MIYQIEDTKDGYKITLLFSHSRGPISGISLETSGGHDELEELFAKAERTWETVREQYDTQLFERLGRVSAA